MLLSLISLIISLVALGFSIFVYLKHDRKLKEYQIHSIEEEQRARRSAVLRVEKIMEPSLSGGNNVYFRITNIGKAKARKVHLHSDPKAMIQGDFDVECLNPGQSEDRYVCLGIEDGDRFHLTFHWDDEEGHHSDEQWICFG